MSRAGRNRAMVEQRLDTPAALSDFRTDGFMVVRGLLPAALVADVRSRIAEVLQRHGWLAPDTPPGQLRPDLNRRDGSPGWWRMYTDIQRIEAMHRLAHHRALVTTVRRLVGPRLLNHPRRCLTLIPPGFRLPAHQEFLHTQGTPDLVSAWIPLNNHAGHAGGLRVLRGARHLLRHRTIPEVGGMEAVVPAQDPDWRTVEPLNPGDVVLLHGLTAWGHDENTGSGLVGALVARYQSKWQPVCPASLRPHHFPRLPGWDVLAGGWSSRAWLRTPWPRRTVPFVLPKDLDRWHEAVPVPPSALVDVRPE